jgi:hypothetical protein
MRKNSLVSRITALFSSPSNDNDAIAILGQLETLHAQMPNKVEAIVRLFQVISPLQDAGGFSQTIQKLQEKNYGKLNEAIMALEVLQAHFQNAGRDEYGYNRTKPGEEVTAAKVFLGNVFGLTTQTAAYCLENKKLLEEENSGYRSNLKSEREYISVWYFFHDYQARNFIHSHVPAILHQIGRFKQAVA